MSPGISSLRNPAVLAAGAKDGGNCLTDTQERRKGRFPPKKKAFCAEAAETFQAMNDLALKRSDPVV